MHRSTVLVLALIPALFACKPDEPAPEEEEPPAEEPGETDEPAPNPPTEPPPVETGGDTGTPPGALPDDGLWALDLTFASNSCSFVDPTGKPDFGRVRIDATGADTFELRFPEAVPGLVLSCTAVGDAFSCPAEAVDLPVPDFTLTIEIELDGEISDPGLLAVHRFDQRFVSCAGSNLCGYFDPLPCVATLSGGATWRKP